ncbi:MAG: pyrroline-5-carboxylate reductase [Candidatus Omnitrophota bacterium]
MLYLRRNTDIHIASALFVKTNNDMKKNYLKNKTMGIIGAGNMGEALISRMHKDFKLLVTDKRMSRKRYLSTRYQIKLLDNNRRLCEQADIIILAVKPQDMRNLLIEIKADITKRHLIISIAAGIKTGFIEKLLGNNIHVVRVMPNTPALIGCGVSCFCYGRFATAHDLQAAESILLFLGEAVLLKEKLFDVVTALSGSGPGFLAYFIECFIQAAKKQGLTEDKAKRLFVKTMHGTARLIEETRISPRALISKAASRGGTTEAGIGILKQYRVNDIINMVIKKATHRAKELSI